MAYLERRGLFSTQYKDPYRLFVHLIGKRIVFQSQRGGRALEALIVEIRARTEGRRPPFSNPPTGHWCLVLLR